jgi:hypothetical protein
VFELFELSDSEENVLSKWAGEGAGEGAISGRDAFQLWGVCTGELKAESETAAGILANSDTADEGLSSFELSKSKLLLSMIKEGSGSSVPSSVTSTARRGSGRGAKRIRREVEVGERGFNGIVAIKVNNWNPRIMKGNLCMKRKFAIICSNLWSRCAHSSEVEYAAM